MTRLTEVAASLHRSVDALGKAGWLLLAATGLFGVMSLYGWSHGLVDSAVNIGLLTVALFCVFLLLILVRNWLGRWLSDRFDDVAAER